MKTTISKEALWNFLYRMQHRRTRKQKPSIIFLRQNELFNMIFIHFSPFSDSIFEFSNKSFICSTFIWFYCSCVFFSHSQIAKLGLIHCIIIVHHTWKVILPSTRQKWQIAKKKRMGTKSQDATCTCSVYEQKFI